MRTILILVFIFLVVTLDAQTNQYQSDLSTLKSVIQKTPSFKTQIKGEKLDTFNALYNRLASDTITNPDSFQYFFNLSQLMFPLRDNHLALYQVPNYNNFKTRASIDSFTNTAAFLQFPSYNINIDSLKIELAKRPADSIEGIYYYDRYYAIGLFKSKAKEYVGVILDSETNLWAKGQIAIRLYEHTPNLYKGIYAHSLYKNFLLQTNERYEYQSLVNSYFYGSYSQSIYSKQKRQVNYVNLSQGSPRFELKNINDNIQYLLLRTFQADGKTSEFSKRFYDSITNSLNAPNLLLDLRNNEGGATKEMKKYFSLLRNYVNKGRLYIITNNGTLSQAEIFALKLKQLKNVRLVGQTTRGMLSYGSNYGRRTKLPSGRFEIYPTDMKGSAKLLQYEDYGIKPDTLLEDDRNWIDQVVEIIQKS